MGPIQALVEKANASERPQRPSAQNISAMRDWRESNRHPPHDGRADGLEQSKNDFERLAAARAGDPRRAAEFIKHISPTVWKSCCVLAAESEAKEVFAEVMAALCAQRFARLSGYSGRSTLQTFVALAAREIVAERMLRLLQSNPAQGWTAFECLFEADIRRVIRKRSSSAPEETQRDLYQEICIALIDDEYRRLKAYSGTGSFAGFVLRTVDHLIIDTLRNEISRRRLPAEVAKLPPLEQEIFKLVHWKGVAERPDVLAAQLPQPMRGQYDSAAIAAALMRVRSIVVPVQTRIASLSGRNGDNLAAPEELSPEAQVLRSEAESHLEAALEAMNEVVEGLDGVERVYLTIVLSAAETPPSREIARLMRRPVEEIYKL